MRVIAGTYRSRTLAAPPGTATRPTSDRLRETLFNILSARLAPPAGWSACHFADLYAGTGAVGIEALSRGAAHCWFAEGAPPAFSVLKKNLGTLRIPPGSHTLEDRGTAQLLAHLRKTAITLDVLFLDPPYEAEAEYASTLRAAGTLLRPGGIAVAEFATRGFIPAERYGTLGRTRVYKQGDSSLAFYELPEKSATPQS